MDEHCVVIADDNESLRFLTVSALEDATPRVPFEAIEAPDGVAALRAVEARVAGGARVLLLSDNRMPGLTGVEVVRRLRERHGEGAVRVTLLTSAPPPDALVVEMGALSARLVERPSDLRGLRALLQREVDAWLGS